MTTDHTEAAEYVPFSKRLDTLPLEEKREETRRKFYREHLQTLDRPLPERLFWELECRLLKLMIMWRDDAIQLADECIQNWESAINMEPVKLPGEEKDSAKV